MVTISATIKSLINVLLVYCDPQSNIGKNFFSLWFMGVVLGFCTEKVVANYYIKKFGWIYLVSGCCLPN